MSNSPVKKRFAIVGTGGRSPMFLDPLVRDYSADGELVGLCDASQVRMDYHRTRLMRDYGCPDVPTYSATDFERMITETKPDVVIVCTIDATHHDYIIRALHLGCDVVTEKPMTTDEVKCRAIFKAVEETGHKVRVSFNLRWTPYATKLRELIVAGTIGTIQSAHLHYQLNTSHGADYFRRWHADKSQSGGLLLHKSTHHFDFVNWAIDAIPSEVFAYNDLKFYGKANAIASGKEAYTRYDRYTDVAEAKTDPFAYTLTDATATELYRNAEQESGYIRDQNVFREGITTEDTMNLLVKYRTGIVLNYSLIAYSPVEGFVLTLFGDKGRIELSVNYGAHTVDPATGQPAEGPDEADGPPVQLRVNPHFAKGYNVEIPVLEGGHGGSDTLLQEQIFSSAPPHDTLGRDAGHEQGAASLLIGAAANVSMVSGQAVKLDDLCPLPAGAKLLSELK